MSALTSAFDALAIARHLERIAGSAAAVELHVFAYLACLLSVYDGRGPREWGYSFSATPAGSPFATSLADATDRIRAAGWLVDRGPSMVLSSAGLSELEALSAFPSQAPRLRYIEAATSAATLLPLPAVADALMYEPQLRRALDYLASSDELLDAQGVDMLMEQFIAISDALAETAPERGDLLVPAVVWLSYLADHEHDGEQPSLAV